MADIESTELHRRISSLEALLLDGKSEKTPQWRIKAAIRKDARWTKLSERLAVATARKRLLESLVESLDARASLLSREISRRALDAKVDL